MNTPNAIPKVFIAKEDAEVFLAYQKHREKFIQLLNAGAFSITSGQVNININNGQILQIYVNELRYKRVAPPIE